MKKLHSPIIASLFIAATLFLSCKESTPAEKVLNAEEKVVEANQELEEANEQYLIDIRDFRTLTAAKITANEQTIVEFKLKAKSQNGAAKADYEKKIAVLEQKNLEMKMKLDTYQASGKDNWESFKNEFNHDMTALGQAFKDLTVNNSN
ncbi:MAG: hypothetical protein RQ735_12065 [Flavobacteriaceae bacterium]|nr:hypothetical protein [Flavobacteriaceae bacterium]